MVQGLTQEQLLELEEGLAAPKLASRADGFGCVTAGATDVPRPKRKAVSAADKENVRPFAGMAQRKQAAHDCDEPAAGLSTRGRGRGRGGRGPRGRPRGGKS